MLEETNVTTETDGAKKEAPAPEPKTETVESLKAQLETVAKALKEANNEAAKRRKRLDELEAEETKRKQDAMTESERIKAELEQTQKELKQTQRAILQRTVADETGLPAVFADRLRGETPDELRQDAEALLKSIPKQPKPQPGTTNPGSGRAGETDAQRRVRLGL
jgi:chromosome segregation ATPase